MCDKVIYEYYDEISKYCDRIIQIDMFILENHSELYKHDKYNKQWINKIVNKWHCFYFDEYKKILFSDIDILPANRHVYNIFNKYNESFVFMCRVNNECTKIVNKNNFQFSQSTNQPNNNDSFDNYVKYGKNHIDGGYLLITPNKTLHKEYFNFIADPNIKTNVSQLSGIDETTLFYFLVHIKKLDYTCFNYRDQNIVPWKTKYSCMNMRELQNKVINSNVYNYLSKVKPFVKPIALMWPEEYIWKIIEKKIISGNRLLKALSIRNAIYCYLRIDDKDIPFNINIANKDKILHANKELKKSFKLNDDIFSGSSIKVIKTNTNKLMRYIDFLNKLNGTINIYTQCCGLIKKDKFADLVYNKKN